MKKYNWIWFFLKKGSIVFRFVYRNGLVDTLLVEIEQKQLLKIFLPPSINLDIKLPDAISQTMASSNNPSKPLLFIFKIEFFFDQKIVDEIEKKKKNFLNMKKLVSNCLIHRNAFYEPIQKGFVEQCQKKYPFWEKFKKHISG